MVYYSCLARTTNINYYNLMIAKIKQFETNKSLQQFVSFGIFNFHYQYQFFSFMPIQLKTYYEVLQAMREVVKIVHQLGLLVIWLSIRSVAIIG